MKAAELAGKRFVDGETIEGPAYLHSSGKVVAIGNTFITNRWVNHYPVVEIGDIVMTNGKLIDVEWDGWYQKPLLVVDL